MAVTDFTCPQRALSTDRSHVPAMVELASVEARRGRSDRARSVIERALATDPDNVSAVAQNVAQLAKSGYTIEAREIQAQAALREGVAGVEAKVDFASLLLSGGRPSATDVDAAEKVLRAALVDGPHNVRAFARLGKLLHISRGDYESAESAFVSALQVEPNHAETLFNYGQFLWQVRRDYVGAVNKYNLAALSDPWNPDVRCSHSGLLAMHGDEEAARALLRQALQIDPTHADSLCALALLLMRHRNLAGAEDHYRRALEVGGPRRPRSFTCSESLL